MISVNHSTSKKWRLKFQGQTQKGAITAAQGTLERRGRLSTASVMLGNTDLVNNSGIVVGHYLRRLTKKIDVGAELVYQYGKQIPGKFLVMMIVTMNKFYVTYLQVDKSVCFLMVSVTLLPNGSFPLL